MSFFNESNTTDFDDEDLFKAAEKKGPSWVNLILIVLVVVMLIVTFWNVHGTRGLAGTVKNLRSDIASLSDKVDSLDNFINSKPWEEVTPPVTEPTIPPRVTERYTTVNLNLRKGAGSTFEILVVMPKGSKVTVLEEGAEWFKVRYTDKDAKVFEGYTAKQYLSEKP